MLFCSCLAEAELLYPDGQHSTSAATVHSASARFVSPLIRPSLPIYAVAPALFQHKVAQFLWYRVLRGVCWQ
jgi:hypothetical protein